MQNDSMPKDYYWLTEQNLDDLIGYCNTKITAYYHWLSKSGLYFVQQRAHNTYYGGKLVGSTQSMFDSAALTRGGKQGELVHAQTNHFSNVVDHTVQLSTSEKPAFQAKANNSDYKSMAQAILGTSIIDYYWDESDLSAAYIKAAHFSLIYGEAVIFRPWNPTKGRDMIPGPNGMIKEGDLEFFVKTPLDCVRDPLLENPPFYIIRELKNRWDLIAKYPNLKDKILQITSYTAEENETFNWDFEKNINQPNSDTVAVWTLFAEKSEALPRGREFSFVGDVALYDRQLLYPNIPIDIIHPRPLSGTPFGFSPVFHLLGVQQIIDILTSTIVTQQSTNGLNNLWTKAEDPVSSVNLPGGMRNLMSETKPEVIQLVQTAPELFNFRDKMIAELETLSGINSTVRGQPEASLKSGNSLALIVSMATNFASLLEASLQEAQENTAMGIITSLITFAKNKRIANIVGAANRPMTKEFSPQDLQSIARIDIEQVNALSKTIAGRMELANNLIQQGFITTAQQYLTVLRTGQIEPGLESAGSMEMLLIRAEGENLREGRPVRALISDRHLIHIAEHLSLLSTPEAREDIEFTTRVLTHVAEHEDQWAQLSQRPALLQATNQQPSPASQQPPQDPNNPNLQQGMPNQELVDPNQQPEGMPSMPSLPPGSPVEAEAAYEPIQQTGYQPQ